MRIQLLTLAALLLSPVQSMAGPEAGHEALPPAKDDQAAEKVDEAKAVAWLGVSAEAAGEELRLHLGLAHGVMLQTVFPQSPADKAGLAAHDILTEVNGKPVDSMEDLRTAIQAHNAGDEIDLKVIQKGKRMERKAVLTKRPAAEQGAGIRILPMGPNGQALRKMQLNLRNLQLQGGANLHFGFGIDGGSFRMNDAEGSVEMKRKDEAREVIVRNRKGEIEFEGPWDTPQDKAAAPPEIRSRIEAVSGMFGGADGVFNLELVPPDPQPQELPGKAD